MLKDYLWDIYNVAMEEKNDGDGDPGDLSDAPQRFVNCCLGKGQPYQCLSGVDKAAFAKRWNALTAEEKGAEYDALRDIRLSRGAALSAAYRSGDRKKFTAIVNQ